MQNTHKLAAAAAFVLTLGVSPAAFSESTGQYIDDATLTTKVKAALLADTQIKATGISVQTNQGTVELSGTVNTADDESQAVKDANNIKGVRAVKDIMVVRGQQNSRD
jgi:osmotically-inducible protein OsmY